MHLIIALILLCVYFGRKGIDNENARSAKEARDRRSKEIWTRHDEFVSKHFDEDLEDDLRELCMAQVDERYNWAASILERNGIKAYSGRVLMVLMAKEGKIPKKYLDKGIKNVVSPPEYTRKQHVQLAEEHWRFMRWYSNWCKQHGIDDELYFSPNIGYTKHERWELTNPQGNDITHGGVFVWEAIDICYPDGAYISISKI